MSRIERRLTRAVGALLLATLAPLAGATLAVAPAASGAAASAAMPEGITSLIADDAAMAFWDGDFDQLEALYRSVRASTERVDGGSTRLQWLRGGLSRVFGEKDATDPYFAQLEALTHQWSLEHPRSPLAQLLYARALHARAWSFRGGDYASRVMPAAMKEFHRYIALEREHLKANTELLKGESTADLYLLMTARVDGLSLQAQLVLAMDELARNAADDTGFTELALASLPRWGGSAAAFDAVAREAARVARPGSGMAMYASIYDDNTDSFEGEMFDVSDVDWPTMRQGFRDWMARWPTRYMLNRFARDACHAQDKPTTREVLDQIADQPLDRAWDNEFESCRRWARSP